MNARPNILIVMYDQLTPSALGCYGNPVTHAPTIDRLARQGVVFDAAYSNSPLCTPARYCMMTGLLPSATRGYDNAAYLASTIPTFAHYARLGGYRTVLDGKMHFVGPDQLHGFEERRTTDIYPADFGWTPDWLNPDERIDWWFHNMDSVTKAGVAEVTNQLLFDDEVGHQGVRALHDLARADDPRPWMLVGQLHPPPRPVRHPRPLLGPLRRPRHPAAAVGADDVPLDPHTARLRKVSAMDEVQIARRTCATRGAPTTATSPTSTSGPRGSLAHPRRARRRRRHRGGAARRPRRHARRARPLVQDELLRGLGPRADDRARAEAVRAQAGRGAGVARGRAADRHRAGRRGRPRAPRAVRGPLAARPVRGRPLRGARGRRGVPGRRGDRTDRHDPPWRPEVRPLAGRPRPALRPRRRPAGAGQPGAGPRLVGAGQGAARAGRTRLGHGRPLRRRGGRPGAAQARQRRAAHRHGHAVGVHPAPRRWRPVHAQPPRPQRRGAGEPLPR